MPPFNRQGLLPEGIHECTLDEAEVRFGCFQKTDRRAKLWSEFRQFVNEAKATGLVSAILLNGSFCHWESRSQRH